MGAKCCCLKDRKKYGASDKASCSNTCASYLCDSSSSAPASSSASSSSSTDQEDTDASSTSFLLTKGKKKRSTQGPWDMDKAARYANEEEKREEARDAKKQRERRDLDQAIQAAQSAPSAATSAKLVLALQKARSIDLTEREPRVSAAMDFLSDREEVSRKALIQATRTKKFTALRASIEEAHALGLECEELDAAEAVLFQERERLLASAAVTAPVSNRDISMLWRRISIERLPITHPDEGEGADPIAPEVAGMERSHHEESDAGARARDNLTVQAELAALKEELQEAEARQTQAAKGAMAGEQRKVAAMYGLASSALQRDVGKLQEAIKEGFDAGLEAKEMHAAWAVLSAEQKRLQARPSMEGTTSSRDLRMLRQDSITGAVAENSEPSVKRDSFGPFSKRGPSLVTQLDTPASSSSFPQPLRAQPNSALPAAASLIHDDVREVNFGAFRGSSMASTIESSSIDGGSKRSSSVSNRPSLTLDEPDSMRVVSLHDYKPAAVRRVSGGSRSMPPSHRISADPDYKDQRPPQSSAEVAAGTFSDSPSSTREASKHNPELTELD